jgi:hypothetical protein
MDAISSHYIVMLCWGLVTDQFFWMLVAQFHENFSPFLCFHCWCSVVFCCMLLTGESIKAGWSRLVL